MCMRIPHASRGFPFYGFKGCRIRGPVTAVCRGVSCLAGAIGDQLDDRRGDTLSRNHDCGQPPGAAATQSQAHAGILFDCSCGYALIGVVAVPSWGGKRSFLYARLYSHQPGSLWNCHGVGRVTGSDDYEAYRGLSRRSPGLALVMLAGVPLSGWDALLSRISWQRLSSSRGHTGSVRLVGRIRHHQFCHRCVLLFETC